MKSLWQKFRKFVEDYPECAMLFSLFLTSGK